MTGGEGMTAGEGWLEASGWLGASGCLVAVFPLGNPIRTPMSCGTGVSWMSGTSWSPIPMQHVSLVCLRALGKRQPHDLGPGGVLLVPPSWCQLGGSLHTWSPGHPLAWAPAARPHFSWHTCTITCGRRSTSSRSRQGAGLTGGWRGCRAGDCCAGHQAQFGMEGGTGAGGQSPALAPWHPIATGAPCKALSWQAALFSSGDTDTKSCSPSQRLPLPPGTTTASQPG